jgi:hypothetical protein
MKTREALDLVAAIVIALSGFAPPAGTRDRAHHIAPRHHAA